MKPKLPNKKAIRYGRSRVCFALKSQAERLWALGKKYLKKGNYEAVNECRRIAFESAKTADFIAAQPDLENGDN
jgi:hypothetical protein